MIFLLIFSAPLAGCSAPSPVGVYTVDAVTGIPVADVRVERFDKKSGLQPVGTTDQSGRLEGIAVKLGNRLTLSRTGYDSRGLEVGFSQAKPLKRVPHSESQKHPEGQFAPDSEEEEIPYPPDRTMIVPMHPSRE